MKTYKKGQQVHVRFDMPVPADCTERELMDFLLWELGANGIIDGENPCMQAHTHLHAEFMSVEVYP